MTRPCARRTIRACSSPIFHGQASTIIDAAPAEVFAAITAIDRLPEWNQRIAHPGVGWAPGC